MYTTAAAWLMTNLTTDPFLVSLEHERVTATDLALQQFIRGFLKGDAKVTHYVTPA
jgi:hypothetical protein